MALMDDVRAGMMAAMKNKDKVRKDALSALLSALKSKMIDNKGVLSEDDAIAVVAREIKQLKETLETAPEAYVEIKEECAAKIAVLSEFMPKQMDVDEIKEVIKGVLDALGIENPEAKLKGIIMKNLMPQVKGMADGKLVNEVLATFFK